LTKTKNLRVSEDYAEEASDSKFMSQQQPNVLLVAKEDEKKLSFMGNQMRDNNTSRVEEPHRYY